MFHSTLPLAFSFLQVFQIEINDDSLKSLRKETEKKNKNTHKDAVTSQGPFFKNTICLGSIATDEKPQIAKSMPINTNLFNVFY